MSPNISREKTLERFGYDPFYLSHQSGMKVVRICPQCGKEKIFRKQVANKHEWCIQCRGRERFKKFTDMKRVYANPAEQKRINHQREYAKPLGYLGTILRTGLRHAAKSNDFQKPYGCFRLLGYTKEEFLEHIQSCLGNGCVICGQPIKDRWHLAHLIPRSFAKTEDDLIRLFQLNNLSVAHPSCNVKLGDRVVEKIQLGG